MKKLIRECRERMRVQPLGVTIPGPRLPERVRCIIDGRSFARISRMRTASAIAACVVLSTALLGVTLSRAQDAGADWEKVAGGKMSFDVASVKANVGSDRGSDNNVPFFGERYPENGGLYSARNAALSLYLTFAYKLSRTQFQVLNSEMPKWAADARFDIQARAPAGATKDQMRLMMQSLLADRFQLKAHFETRDMPVYALSLVKPGVTGPKLRPHTEDPPCVDGSMITTSSGSLVTTPLGFPMRCGSAIGSVNYGGGTYAASYGGRDVSMQTITESFISAPNNPPIDRPVIDRTGLAGNYDFIVKYWPQSNSTSPPPDDAGPILFEALRQDLGLKLESTTAPFNKLIIDHIEEPTPN
jgi:uncharacterized protein (TIGR03435 family)